MRIVTPSDAAFLPSGGTFEPGRVVASYINTYVATGNLAPTTETFFVPVDGQYAFGYWIETLSPSTTGTLTVTVDQLAIPSTYITAAIDLSVDGTTLAGGAGRTSSYATAILLAAGGAMTLSREVTLFTGVSATYIVRVNFYLVG